MLDSDQNVLVGDWM